MMPEEKFLVQFDASGGRFTLMRPDGGEAQVFPSIVDAIKHIRVVKLAEKARMSVIGMRGTKLFEIFI